MPDDYNPTAFNAAKCMPGCYVEYPFRDQGDTDTKIYHHVMNQIRGSYAPLSDDDIMTAAAQKPDGSPFADDPAAYYIGDSIPQPRANGIYTFDRMFANVPADLQQPGGLYAFEFPGVPGGIYTSGDSTSESSSYNTGTLKLTLIATLSPADAELINDGDYVTIGNPNNWQYAAGATNYTRPAFYGNVQKSGNTFTVVLDFFYTLSGVPTAFTGFTDNSPTHYTVRKTLSSRDEAAIENSASLITYRYVKAAQSDLSSITLRNKYSLTSAAGAPLTATTASSVPHTTESYRAAALAGEYIPADDETITRWHGNIYQLSQTVVRMK